MSSLLCSPVEARTEAHPAPLPSWNSGPVAAATAASGLGPPPPCCSRLPHILKILCFLQEPVQFGQMGWDSSHAAMSQVPQKAPGNAAPTCSLTPTPTPQHNGVPVLGVHSSLRVPQSWTPSSVAGTWYPRPQGAHSPLWDHRPLGRGRTPVEPSWREARPARGSPGGKPSDTVKTKKESDVRLIKIVSCHDQSLNSLEQSAREAHKVVR